MPFIKCWRVVAEHYFSVNSALQHWVPNQQTALHWGLIYGQIKWKVNWLEMVFQIWIQRCLRSLLSYHLCEDMLLTLLCFPLWVLYPGECSMPAAARWVAWHWEILNCIFQDRLFALYAHKDGEKNIKVISLICCYWLLWSILCQQRASKWA